MWLRIPATQNILDSPTNVLGTKKVPDVAMTLVQFSENFTHSVVLTPVQHATTPVQPQEHPNVTPTSVQPPLPDVNFDTQTTAQSIAPIVGWGG